MWNIILTFSVCIVLALLLDASIVMLGRDVYNKISEDEKEDFINAMFILTYIILLALVFTKVIGLGKLTLLIIVIYVIISIICRNKNKLFNRISVRTLVTLVMS